MASLEAGGGETRKPVSLLAALRKYPFVLAIGIFMVLLVVNAILQKNFFSSYALSSHLTAFLPLMLIATGQTYVVLGGSIDLSLGAIVSLVNVVVVVLIEQLGGGPGALVIGMAVGIAVGTLCGLFSGALVAIFRIQAVVTTFATGIIFGGLALIVLPQAGGTLPEVYYLTYGAGFFGLTLPVYIIAALFLFALFMARTRFYRYLLAIGGNRQAAYQTGLPARLLTIASHGVAGCMSALAALCILGVAGAGDPLMGQAFTLGSVSAVVLGGTALSGGWGSVIGSIAGAASLGLINNVIFFANINYVYQSIVQGGIVLVALAAGVFVSRKFK